MNVTHLLAHLLRDQNTPEYLMEHFEDLSTIAEASVMELKQVKGISVAKAETIQVASEISRRLTQTKTTRSPTVTNPHGIYCLLKEEYRGLHQEVLKIDHLTQLLAVQTKTNALLTDRLQAIEDIRHRPWWRFWRQ